MNDEVLVSAIIPTFNRGYVVCKAIDSILNQTYKHTEIIVVDDGSTDDTQQMLARYGDRIRVVYQKNSGPSAARNRGITASQGEVVAFLDSDDIWLPTKLERQVSLLQRVPSTVPCCLCNGITRSPSGEAWEAFDTGLLYPSCAEGLWLNTAEVLATRFILFCQLVAIRRDALEKVGYFDEGLGFMEDYDLALRLSAEGPWGFIREPLAAMTIYPADSLSLKVSNEHVRHSQYMLKSRERLYRAMRSNGGTPTGLGLLRQAIKRTRRELWVAKLRESDYWPVRFAGNFFKRLARYEMALFRRSPWFPKAKTISVET
jgi:glycosyltransferase involved in cell wall biosynthesis